MTSLDLHPTRSLKCGSALGLLAASLLAWCCPGNLAAAQSFLTATEDQAVEASESSSPWYNPFGWTNDAQAAAPPVRRQAPPAQAAAPAEPRFRLADLNPFGWTNAPRVEQPPKPAPRAGTVATDAPPASVIPAVATDGPVQPKSVQQASATSYPNTLRPQAPGLAQPLPLRQPINWPPTPQVVQTSTQAGPVAMPLSQSKAGQGVNPFNWSNAGPTTYDDLGTNRVPFEQQPLGQAMRTAQQPMQWSNDPRGQAAPRELLPPEEKSFGETFQESLSFVQPGGNGTDELAHTLPPVGATDAEMIEWEKEHLPFTRPFYASNDPEHEIPFHPSEANGSGAPELDLSVLQRPFTMSNNPQPAPQYRPAPAPQPQRVIAPDVSRDTRRVTYLQNPEQLPQPLQTPADPNSGVLGRGGTGALAEAEKIGEEPPESNTLQFLRADTVLLDPGEWQFDYGFTYTKFDSEFPALIDIGGGNVTVADAQFRIREFQVPFELRYGLARRVQAFLNVPFGWVNNELTVFDTLERFENDGGLGDVTFGSTFLLREHDECKPDAILTLAASAPTGDDPFAPTAIGAPAAPTLGSGTWALASNLLFIQNYDPVVVFYGFGTRQPFQTEISGVNFRPGGEYNYMMGVGFAVNSTVTFSTRFNGAYVTEARLAGERIRGTISEPMTLTVAMTMAKCDKLIEPFVDFGLTDDAVDARIGVTWTR